MFSWTARKLGAGTVAREISTGLNKFLLPDTSKKSWSETHGRALCSWFNETSGIRTSVRCCSSFSGEKVSSNCSLPFADNIETRKILCGCGGLDGTEIAEAVSVAIHCSQNDLLPRFFAPDMELCGLVDHLTREPDTSGVARNALVEGARLARPTIKSLCECKACAAGALIIPGGYGAARTLSDFASKGADCAVLPELRRIMEEFNCDKKPIGTLCIASALTAKIFKGAKVTLGKESPKEDWPYGAAIKRVKDMGANVEMKDVTGVTYCKRFNLFSNPAWLYSRATYAEVHKGIGKMISKMKKNIVH